MARDLMFQPEIKETVQQAYAAITGGGEIVARRHYSDQELVEVPPGPSRGPWGWATPSATPGSSPARRCWLSARVGGIDTILAARRVGPEDRAIGLDVLEEMWERGRSHAAQAVKARKPA